MSGEPDLLDRLAQSIADGASIDWDEIDRLPADEGLRKLLKVLRVVDDVAEVHRSAADDVAPSSDRITTRPAGTQLSQKSFGARGQPAPRDPQDSGGLGQWGHLQLLRKIGEGSFGVVYHAHDTWLDHPVALKLLKSTVAGRDLSSRILHEARKLARVRHPNVVTVHGADSHDGQVGFWMDLVQGTTLEQLVLGGRLSAGEATYIGQEVCRALAAVHQAKLVHRDVKAQNVMRAKDGGRIILMDFGAGEFINDRPATSRRQGTPLYLAPEILAGEHASVRSDIYAVGVLLYYLVTSNFPVRAASVPDLIGAHQRGERRRLRDRRPDLPDSFISVVERAIDPDPARRFASAGEMDAALSGGTTPGVRPIDIDRLPFSSKDRTALQKVELAVLATAVAIVATEVFGLIASRVFEVALGIAPDFAAGPSQYFSVGVSALLPFVIFWLAGAAVLGVLAGLRPLFRAPLESLRKRWSALTASLDPATLATVVFLSGVGSWLMILWPCWGLFTALEALRVGATASTADLSVLSSAAHSLHRAYGNDSAWLSFVLGLAVWQWFPSMEQRADDASRVRVLKWATVGVAFMVVAMAIAPRRFIFDRFEVVAFDNQPAFVIGTSNEELLLYSPQGDRRKQWRVRKDATTLRRTDTSAKIFDPQ
jgi:hypothetical protein